MAEEETRQQEEAENGLDDNQFDLAFEAAAGGEDVADDAEAQVTASADGEETTSDDNAEAQASADDADDGEGASDDSGADTKTDQEAAAAQTEAEKEAEADKKAEADRRAAEAKAEEDRKAAEAKAEEDRKQQEAAKEAERLAAEAAEREKYTDEETEILKTVEKDFPEVQKALQAVERVTMARLENKFEKQLNERVQAIATQFQQQFSAIAPTVQSAAANAWEQTVFSKHPDAKELMPEIDAWVETLPPVLKNTYNNVLDNGTAADTVDVINHFKEATGRTSKGASDDGAADAEKAAAEEKKKKEREKKLQAQEGVKGRNSQERSAIDPNDFDGAFEKFAVQ